MTKRAIRPSGFTLIELMIVVAIVGVLASVATPMYTRLNLRSRTAERDVVMSSIHRAVGAIYLQDGKVSAHGAPNPSPAPTNTKHAFERRTDPDGWAKASSLVTIEGATYYQYEFLAVEPGGNAPASLQIWATGDLDDDGATSGLWRYYERLSGVYQTDPKDETNHWCAAQVNGADLPGECIPDQTTF
jgi:prepilin-type N-terminal cleavage/methylation domain-containing protein